MANTFFENLLFKLDFIVHRAANVFSTDKKAAPTLSTLPPELGLSVLESCDNFASATTLARSSRVFNFFWVNHTRAIFERIQARNMPEPDMFQIHEIFAAYKMTLGFYNPETLSGLTNSLQDIAAPLSGLGLTLLKAFERQLSTIASRGLRKGLYPTVALEQERGIILQAIFRGIQIILLVGHLPRAPREPPGDLVRNCYDQVRNLLASLNKLEYAQMAAMVMWLYECQLESMERLSDFLYFQVADKGIGEPHVRYTCLSVRFWAVIPVDLPYQPEYDNIFLPFVKYKYRKRQMETWSTEEVGLAEIIFMPYGTDRMVS